MPPVIRGVITGAIVAAGLALLITLAAPAPEAAAAKRCGKITIRYSYGSYRFKVWVYKGNVTCSKARRVMRQGIPISRPDPRGWTCVQGPDGANYSDVCRARNPKRSVRALVLL
jgi:hypothetical protein